MFKTFILKAKKLTEQLGKTYYRGSMSQIRRFNIKMSILPKLIYRLMLLHSKSRERFRRNS